MAERSYSPKSLFEDLLRSLEPGGGGFSNRFFVGAGYGCISRGRRATLRSRANPEAHACPELVQRRILGPPHAGDAKHMYLHFLLFFCGDGSTYVGQWFAPGGFSSDFVGKQASGLALLIALRISSGVLCDLHPTLPKECHWGCKAQVQFRVNLYAKCCGRPAL